MSVLALALVGLTWVPCEGAPPPIDLFPVLSLEGPKTQHFGSTLYAEPYADPGYNCYNPGSCYLGNDCPEGKVDVDVSMDPDLTKEGTYVIKYTCKNAKGAAATPIYRTVIVDFKKEEEYWEAQAEMQFTGYTSTNWGKNETRLFKAGLAKTMNLPSPEFVEVSAVESCTVAQRKALGLCPNLFPPLPLPCKKCINVLFSLSCVQESLLDQLVAMLEDDRFDAMFEKELKEKQHLHVNAFAVDHHMSITQVVTMTAKLIAAAGFLLVVATIAIGAQKFNELANSEKVAFSSDAEERQALQGGVHERL